MVHTLASGSSGNALVLSWNGRHLLVDAGISCRRIAQSLGQLGLSPEALEAVLITHTHTDHISGLQTLLKRTSCPVFATSSACRDLLYRFAGAGERLESLPLCQSVQFSGLTITAFPTSHDSPGSCGYRFDTPEGSAGLLTDTGYVTPEAEQILPGVDIVVLEANHDIPMLEQGSYPYFLKRRILGDRGHLDNCACARFAVTLAKAGAQEIVLAHLSRENNTPAIAHQTVSSALAQAGLSPELFVAPRDCSGGPYDFHRRMLCSG